MSVCSDGWLPFSCLFRFVEKNITLKLNLTWDVLFLYLLSLFFSLPITME